MTLQVLIARIKCVSCGQGFQMGVILISLVLYILISFFFIISLFPVCLRLLPVFLRCHTHFLCLQKLCFLLFCVSAS